LQWSQAGAFIETSVTVPNRKPEVLLEQSQEVPVSVSNDNDTVRHISSSQSDEQLWPRSKKLTRVGTKMQNLAATAPAARRTARVRTGQMHIKPCTSARTAVKIQNAKPRPKRASKAGNASKGHGDSSRRSASNSTAGDGCGQNDCGAPRREQLTRGSANGAGREIGQGKRRYGKSWKKEMLGKDEILWRRYKLETDPQRADQDSLSAARQG
jgi:hypothetical protein